MVRRERTREQDARDRVLVCSPARGRGLGSAQQPNRLRDQAIVAGRGLRLCEIEERGSDTRVRRPVRGLGRGERLPASRQRFGILQLGERLAQAVARIGDHARLAPLRERFEDRAVLGLAALGVPGGQLVRGQRHARVERLTMHGSIAVRVDRDRAFVIEPSGIGLRRERLDLATQDQRGAELRALRPEDRQLELHRPRAGSARGRQLVAHERDQRADVREVCFSDLVAEARHDGSRLVGERRCRGDVVALPR